MRIRLEKFGLSHGRAVALLCFAAFWIALQVLLVTIMLDLNLGPGEIAAYCFDCLRDLDRICNAFGSILQFILGTVTIVLFIFAVIKKFSARATGKFLIALGLTLIFALSVKISNLVIEARLANAVENAAPLIAALKNYEKETGHPPSSLQSLVPKYMAAIPQTGIGNPTDFQYSLSKKHRWYLFFPFVFQLPHRPSCLVYLADENYGQELVEQSVSDDSRKNHASESTFDMPDMLRHWAFAERPLD
jgi:hypothetical protein